MPFMIYGGGGEVSASSAAVYSNLAFTFLYQYSLLVFLRSFPFFSYSTGTDEYNDFVALGAAQ